MVESYGGGLATIWVHLEQQVVSGDFSDSLPQQEGLVRAEDKRETSVNSLPRVQR